MNPRRSLRVLVVGALAAGGCAQTIGPPAPDGGAPDTPAADTPPPERCPVTTGPLRVREARDLGTTTLADPEPPLDAEERAFNRAHGPDEQYVAWSMSRVDDGRGGALVYYGRYLVRPGFLNFTALGVGVGRVAPGARDVARAPGFVFRPPGDLFGHGAVTDGGYVYVYGCRPVAPLDAECRVARAPAADAARPERYEVWDGRAWARDLARAAVVMRGTGGQSVRWNRHLARYLSVSGEILGDRVYLRAAPRPEGPWTAPVLAFAGLPTHQQRTNFAAQERTELEPGDGCTVVVTYAHPRLGQPDETRVVEVALE